MINIKDANKFYVDLSNQLQMFSPDNALFFALFRACISNNQDANEEWIEASQLRNYFDFMRGSAYGTTLRLFKNQFRLISSKQESGKTYYTVDNDAIDAFFDSWVQHGRPMLSDPESQSFYDQWLEGIENQQTPKINDVQRLKEKLQQSKGAVSKSKYSSVKGQTPQDKKLIDDLDEEHIARALAFCYEKLVNKKARTITPTQLSMLEDEEIALSNGNTYPSLNDVYLAYPIPTKEWAHTHLYNAFIKWNRRGSITLGSIINTAVKVDMKYWGLKDYLQSKNIYIDKANKPEQPQPVQAETQYTTEFEPGSVEDLENKLAIYMQLGMPAIKIANLKKQIDELKGKQS